MYFLELFCVIKLLIFYIRIGDNLFIQTNDSRLLISPIQKKATYESNEDNWLIGTIIMRYSI
jgi:hypothetical protein